VKRIRPLRPRLGPARPTSSPPAATSRSTTGLEEEVEPPRCWDPAWLHAHCRIRHGRWTAVRELADRASSSYADSTAAARSMRAAALLVEERGGRSLDPTGETQTHGLPTQPLAGEEGDPLRRSLLPNPSRPSTAPGRQLLRGDARGERSTAGGRAPLRDGGVCILLFCADARLQSPGDSLRNGFASCHRFFLENEEFHYMRRGWPWCSPCATCRSAGHPYLPPDCLKL
jgi:hypothetical protein